MVLVLPIETFSPLRQSNIDQELAQARTGIGFWFRTADSLILREIRQQLPNCLICKQCKLKGSQSVVVLRLVLAETWYREPLASS